MLSQHEYRTSIQSQLYLHIRYKSTPLKRKAQILRSVLHQFPTNTADYHHHYVRMLFTRTRSTIMTPMFLAANNKMEERSVWDDESQKVSRILEKE
jgi:hypothetical protein